MLSRLFSSLRLLRRSLLLVAVISFIIASRVLAAEPASGARLSIPSIDLDAPIVAIHLNETIGTWDTSQLGDLIGHFQYTPWVTERGNVVLGGHSTDSEGAPSIFYALEDVAIGDFVSVQEGSSTFEYEITGIRYVEISDLTVLYPTRQDTITLITCAGFNTETEVYEQRLVVTARRAD
jgi:LPXTG-site transpeptidase (sortase) family protein